MIKASFDNQQPPVKILQQGGKVTVFICLNERKEIRDCGEEQYATLVYDYNEIAAPEGTLPLEDIEAHPEKYLDYAYKDPAKTQTELTQLVQDYMDSKARERGYDSILNVCSYVESGNAKFDREGALARVWRSAVWTKCYSILDDVLRGYRPIPSEAELLSELPKLEW